MNEMNNILVFDTATTACSVALKTKTATFSRHEEQANIHSKALLIMVDDLLNETNLTLSDVDLLVIGNGPGSFTGLRIGMGVAQGLAYSNAIPVVMLSTLEMIALNGINNNSQGLISILVAHDARMAEMYVAKYQFLASQRLTTIIAPFLLKPSQFDLSELKTAEEKLVLSGNAWQIYADQFESDETANLIADSSSIFPDASKVAKYICQYTDSFEVKGWDDLSPLYVRNNVAKKSLTL